ncbi:MAG: hypothetical protein IPN29_07280 [Saprospiraceae bacterium]|nr:hypothetical protein [Saprospiraceae bacterium]
MYRYVWILLIAGFVNVSRAQDSIARLQTIVKVETNNITLRWAPNTSIAWHKGLEAGYKIERAVNKQGSSEMNDFKVLKEKVMPWSRDKWLPENIADYDKYCIIAAELLYGKSKYLEGDKLLKRTDEFKNKYVYAMMSADFSAQAAEALGLRFVDTDIQPNNVYIYRISSLAANENYPIESSTTIAYASQLTAFNAPEIYEVKALDRAIKILWLKEQPTNYTGYFIEKSENGQDFIPLNESPFMTDDNIGNKEYRQYHVFVDSLDRNYKTYHYRIKGITPFGEVGPVSEVKSIYGIDLTPPSKPSNVTSSQLGSNTLEIFWEFPDIENGELKGFLVGRSNQALDSFSNITQVILPSTARSYLDENANPLKPNFYFVTAIDTAGNYNISLSHYAHLIDSIPPQIPTGLHGSIDSSGHVTLSWNRNPESDLLGYNVFFSNQEDHVFAAVTNKPISQNRYVDTIMVQTLTEDIFYSIVAVDKNHNISSFSNTLKLVLPDMVAPAIAVFSGFEKSKESVTLNWINSKSRDVTSHVIYRRTAEQSSWIRVFECNNLQQNSWMDTGLAALQSYHYKIHAIDDAGLESKESNVIKVIAEGKEGNGNEVQLKATAIDNKSIKLAWNTLSYAKKYIVYKKSKSGRYETLVVTKNSEYIDKDFDINNIYSIRYIHENGIHSEFAADTAVKSI